MIAARTQPPGPHSPGLLTTLPFFAEGLGWISVDLVERE